MSTAPSQPRPLLSVPEVAAWLNCSQKTAWRLVGKGELAKVKVGARTLVQPESVEQYLDRGGDA